MCFIHGGAEAADAPPRENANAAAKTVPAAKTRRLRFMRPPFSNQLPDERKNNRHGLGPWSTAECGSVAALRIESGGAGPVPIPVPEMTASETDRVTWRNTWRWIVGLAACGALGWWAFVRDARVPLLSLGNL